MRPYIVIAAAVALAPAIFAQTTEVPECVYTCITQSAALTSCATTDTACLCGSNAFIDGAVSCMEASCDADSLAVGVQFGQQYCALAGVTVTISTGAASATEAASAAESSLPASVSSAVSSAATSAASAASSAASSASSVQSTASAASSSASAPAPSQTGAASSLVAGSALALVGAGAALLL